MTIRDRLRTWLGIADAPPPSDAGWKIDENKLYMLGREQSVTPAAVYTPAAPPPMVKASNPRIAMDYGLGTGSVPAQAAAWGIQGMLHEGIGWLGYPYLAELTQRPEYRRISEIRAREATRKWIRFTGVEGDPRRELEDAFKLFDVQDKFREIAEQDGFFGRAHLYIDLGAGDDENTKPLIRDNAKVARGSLKGLRTVESLWCYPLTYNSTNPLAPDFYKPQTWAVMAKTIHSTRLLTFIGREVPDILKPAYAFGGLSLSQMAKPYVDNWLRTRQSVSDLLHSFSVMVLKTKMGVWLQQAATGIGSMLSRAMAFCMLRDNKGVFMIDKETEEFDNVAVPLGSLDKLQAQAQEHMASVAGIPLIVLFAITPSGLNASSEGELAVFHADILGYQEDVFRPNLHVVLDVIQLHLWGKIDPDIGFEFELLGDVDETALAAIRKSDADASTAYINAGVITNEEDRERLKADEDSPYHGLLDGPAPEMPSQMDQFDAQNEQAEAALEAKSNGGSDANNPNAK